ncbi:MAG: dipeptide epimerase [Caulobacteraceae bacterium]|nr:dipeptide epimerase [Caulobacteraceae bacterium]
MRLEARAEAWPIHGRFVISRGAKTRAETVLVTLEDGMGRGECVPYARYGETAESVLAQIAAAQPDLETGCDTGRLQLLMKPGAARNAVDCALWDLEAKRTGVRAWKRAGLPALLAQVTAFTLSLDTPERMAAAARANAERPLLKLKIGGRDDVDRVAAVRGAAPNASLIVDANESLVFAEFQRLAPELAKLRVDLIEQPLKAGEDEDLEGYPSPVPLCADESLHTRAELAACARRYAVANIKLDKTGGLTEALALKAAAQAQGMKIMVGCMVATSLSMAPAMLLAQGAAFVDLDGPLLLEQDRAPGLAYDGSRVEAPSPALWG